MSGRNATLSGAALLRNSRIRSDTSSSTRRRWSFYAVALSRHQRRHDSRTGGEIFTRCGRLGKRPCSISMRRAAGHFNHTDLDDCRTEGLISCKDALGAQDRNAALLCLSGTARASRSPISETRVNREARNADEERTPSANMFRRRRDHGRQRSGPRILPSRHRHDHRQRLRSHRGTGGCKPMRATDMHTTGGACKRGAERGRSPDGGLAIPVAIARDSARCSRRWKCAGSLMTGRPELSCESLPQLRALAISTASSPPPHEFEVNVPRALAHVRAESIRGPMLAARIIRPVRAQRSCDQRHRGAERRRIHSRLRRVSRTRSRFVRCPFRPGAFYRLMPHNAMALLFRRGLSLFGYGDRDGRADVSGATSVSRCRPWASHDRYGRTMKDAGSMRYLDGGEAGCMNHDDRPTDTRKHFQSPRDVLRIPALLRRDGDGDAVSLPARTPRRLTLGMTSPSSSGPSAVSDWWSARSAYSPLNLRTRSRPTR